jgi:hypothetical protein
MGFKKWISRKLTVGGTARLFAKQYNWFRINKFKSTASNKLIFKEIIICRFKFPHIQKLMQMIEEDEIKGLKDLVIETLSIEAGFRENTIENQIMFSEIIEEELIKKGIPLNVIK